MSREMWAKKRKLAKDWTSRYCSFDGTAALTSTPVVFIHRLRGDLPPFLEITVAAACEMNDVVIVVLVVESPDTSVGDKTYALDARAEVVIVAENSAENILSASLRTLDEQYVHVSVNDPTYEKFCIQRWFLLESFARLRGIDSLVYVDCDVLLLANMTEEIYSCYSGCDIMHTGVSLVPGVGSFASGHTSFWRLGALSEFTSFVLQYYSNDTNTRIQNESFVADHANTFSDMSLIGLFSVATTKRADNLGRHLPNICGYDSDRVTNGLFDLNGAYARPIGFFRDAESGLFFSMTPEGDILRMKSVHFQGYKKSHLLACPASAV